MTHRVQWLREAQFELLEYWADLDAKQFTQVSSAVEELERRLSVDPENEGESRQGKIRIAFEGPLGVYFFIDADDRLVSIMNAWVQFKGFDR